MSTASASGTKKVRNATPQSTSEVHPYTATGGTLLMLTMATILRRTRSHRPRVRWRRGELTNYSDGCQAIHVWLLPRLAERGQIGRHRVLTAVSELRAPAAVGFDLFGNPLVRHH